MKAAVIYSKGTMPQYTDYPEPVINHPDELLVTVKAVAIKHLDKSRAAGNHYSSNAPKETGRVVGGDGVCLLPGGQRVYAMGVSGMLAERAVIDKTRVVPIPDGLDNACAAALPNAVIGAAMALRFKAGLKPGETVLINGATGFTGRVAVQIARHYGAKKIIVTGRNQQSLNELKLLGADETIAIMPDNTGFSQQLAALHAATPFDVIIDYLWGDTAALIMDSLKGDGSFKNRVRYVSVGSMAGDVMPLSAAIMRSIDIQLTGSGMGAWSKAQVGSFFEEILPEMYQLAANGGLKIKTTTVSLQNIAGLWDMEVSGGERLVVTI